MNVEELDQNKILSLKYQLLSLFGYFTLFVGLLFYFLSEQYLMLQSSRPIFVIIDCVGGVIVLLSTFFTFYTQRKNIEQLRLQLIMEMCIFLTFSFTLQSLVFHILFPHSFAACNTGIYFIFIAYCLVIACALLSLDKHLTKHAKIFFGLFCFASAGAVVSGIFLTFTGAAEPIIEQGVGVLSLGAVSFFGILTGLIFYPIIKNRSAKDEDDKEINEDQVDITSEND